MSDCDKEARILNDWIPTLDDFFTAIITRLSTIKVDVAGNGVLQPIHVTHFTPEAEEAEDRNTLRPAIVVYLYDQVHDARRETSLLANRFDINPTDISLKRVPTPMKFFYQFTILTDYQQHMNEITRQLNMLFPTRGYITLTAPSGEKVSYDFFQRSVDNGYTHQFLQYGANEQERIFKKIFRYHLFTEIEEYEANTYKKVLSVHPNVRGIENN